MAKQGVQRAMQYQYRDRRNRKRDFRKLWITRINAAAREHGMSYSVFMKKLSDAGITLDRKILAQIAATEPAAFKGIVESISKSNK